ncbi:MAG: hypothetical protein JSR43_05760 [Proteobacteria bacterium]|nr:hypothetical protein [Pseudomonadota bacterium]
MRIFPLVLIAVGTFGVLQHYGLVDPAFVHLFWPLLLIGIGVALLVRGPRWRGDANERMQDRWERRMGRHFGPGWASLSEEERERFRAGMRHWRSHGWGGDSPAPPAPPAPPAAAGPPPPRSTAPPPAPGEQR